MANRSKRRHLWPFLHVGLRVGVLGWFFIVFPAFPAVFTVTLTGDSGAAGTLRWAITNANATAGTDTVAFAISGSGPFNITPNNPLPAITDPIIVDGTTQTGYSNHPVVVIKGGSAGANADGLRIQAGNSMVLGMAINNFSRDGIRIETNGNNVIQGSFLGTDSTGTSGLGNVEAGVYIVRSANNLIGGSVSSNRNLLSDNFAGVYIQDPSSTNNQIAGNYIGTDVNGASGLGNQSYGVLLESSANTVGGANPGEGNIISNNKQFGIYIHTTAASNNIVLNNVVGLGADGLSLGNFSGVTVSGGTGNTIMSNVISGNLSRGVDFNLLGTGANSNVLQGNLIGTDLTGKLSRANRTNGIALSSSTGNVIGGTNAAARNVISGNGSSGVFISSAQGTFIGANFIGVDITGTNALGNALDGIHIFSGTGTVIGGAVSGARNVLSGNTNDGVFLEAGAPGTLVQGNFIGTDVNGTRKLPNWFSGIRVDSGTNLIGGAIGTTGNLLSGNAISGVLLFGVSSVGNTVAGNFIGTDVTGSTALANGNDGIDISSFAANNTIGGTTAAARNVISGNSFAGIYFSGVSAATIQGNFIGTKADGLSPLGNVFHNVEITNSYNLTIGGTAAGSGNRIAFSQSNPYSGVRVRSGNVSAGNSTNVLISGNMIFSNNFLGIDLGAAGINGNVGCNSGTGNIANNGQNYPVLSLAASDANSIGVKGTLNSTAGTQFRLQFFANPTCAPAGAGQGRTFLGEGLVTTDGSCNAAFTATINSPVTPGQVIAATAIDPNGNTSEFSACVPVTAAPPLTIAWATPPPAGDPQIALSWPVTAAGFVLKQTASLTPPVLWTSVTNSITVSNLNNVVTVSTSGTNQFFRLSFE